MAAAYFVHLARNHPFVEGNERIALMTAIVFLGLDGLRLEADPEALLDLVLDAAQRKVSKAQVAVFFESNTGPWS